MGSQVETHVAHINTPLAVAPPTSFFDEVQWRVYYALMDTVIPSIVSGTNNVDKLTGTSIKQSLCDSHYETIQKTMAHPPARDAFEAYLSEKPSDNQDFRDHMARTLTALPTDTQTQLGWVLYLLGTRVGSYPLTGYRKPFHLLPVPVREAIIQSWQVSWIPSIRNLAKSVTILGKKVWVQTSPLWRQLSGWADLPAAYKTGAAWEYGFKQFTPGLEPVTIETDVVIVGSGCGGAVCAKVLAEAGLRVLVVDKGYYFPPAQLPMTECAAEGNLFENEGIMTAGDGSVAILAGSCWGGGGSINWGVSLKTPDFVRRQWAEKRGLSFFATDRFQESLDRVCDVMGASDSAVRHNHRGQALLDGAKKLGWEAKTTPHNSGGEDHYCGHCHLGCGSGQKRGPAVSWLPAASRAGAEFIEGFHVERVTFEAFAAGKKASGVVGRWVSRDENGGTSGSLDQRTTREVVIKAKRVIISCGTLWSPIVLRKSGLANPQIGRNLYLHPVNMLAAFWKEDIRPWEGPAISSVCTTFEDLDNEGHGVKLEPTCEVPYIVVGYLPWRNGVDFKLTALKYRRMNAFIAITRDRDTGLVYPDPISGKPRFSYTPSAFDRGHAMEGVVALARICYATGAEEIRPFLSGARPFTRSDAEGDAAADDQAFEAWLEEVRAAGNPPTAPWASAHQMGSCRMSKSENDGVVDPRGKVWGIEGLYVADASVFPSASGVNPMVTNMAIADWIARGIVEDLKRY